MIIWRVFGIQHEGRGRRLHSDWMRKVWEWNEVIGATLLADNPCNGMKQKDFPLKRETLLKNHMYSCQRTLVTAERDDWTDPIVSSEKKCLRSVCCTDSWKRPPLSLMWKCSLSMVISKSETHRMKKDVMKRRLPVIPADWIRVKGSMGRVSRAPFPSIAVPLQTLFNMWEKNLPKLVQVIAVVCRCIIGV